MIEVEIRQYAKNQMIIVFSCQINVALIFKYF